MRAPGVEVLRVGVALVSGWMKATVSGQLARRGVEVIVNKERWSSPLQRRWL